ncbi:MAG: hypothetical protein M1830_006800, partial [Pleopsidium flavum]
MSSTMNLSRKSHRLSILEKPSANAVTQESDLVPDGELTKPDAVRPGSLSLKEDAAGGLGRHLGLFSTTFL